MKRTKFSSACVLVLALLLLPTISSACIGEVAGKLHFNVTLGGNQTLQFQIFNACQNVTIDFTTFAKVDPLTNMTTPNITITPRHGTVVPGANYYINVTVVMPANAIANTTWSGGLAAVESANQLASSGANLQGGVAKRITIMAIAPPKKPFPVFLAGLIAVVLIAAGIGAVAVHSAKRNKLAKKKVAKPSRFAFLKAAPEKKMTYAEFKKMEAQKRATKRKSGAKPRARAKRKAGGRTTRRRRR